MKHCWLYISLLTLVLLGCGGDSHQVYDSNANPANFPPAALDLIDALDSGTLTGFDAITGAFGSLYTDNSELLDNKDWKDVVSRLGARFGELADSSLTEGLPAYARAAEYYQLGSFARPDDPDLRHQAEFFSAWMEARDRAPEAVAALAGAQVPSYEGLTAVLRTVLLTDTLSRRFYREKLQASFETTLSHSDLLSAANLAERSAADLALLRLAGLIGDDLLPEPRISFGPPTIDVMAARLSRVDSVTYLVEVYLLPREPIDSVMRVNVVLQSDPGPNTTLEIMPAPMMYDWPVDQIGVVARQFRYPSTIFGAQIGLIELRENDQIRFLMPKGAKYHYWSLDPDQLDLN